MRLRYRAESKTRCKVPSPVESRLVQRYKSLRALGSEYVKDGRKVTCTTLRYFREAQHSLFKLEVRFMKSI